MFKWYAIKIYDKQNYDDLISLLDTRGYLYKIMLDPIIAFNQYMKILYINPKAKIIECSSTDSHLAECDFLITKSELLYLLKQSFI